MKKIQLGGHNKDSKIRGYAIVDDEDYEWLNQWKWHSDLGYARRNINIGFKKQKRVIMHRVILNAKKGDLCDHVNRNRLDNRRENLRLCTASQNAMNKGLSKKNTSGFRGVVQYKKNKKWIAQTKKDGEHIYIGSFDNILDAARAYDRVAKKYHGEFSRPNFSNNKT